MSAEEINELDNKYIVVKWQDVFNPNSLTTEEYDVFMKCLNHISENRKRIGKHNNKYVVLNLDDELVIDYLLDAIEAHKKDLNTPYIAVNDIAVDLVNAIIKARNPQIQSQLSRIRNAGHNG